MFDIPQEFQDRLKNAMKDEHGVKLPFAAPTMWWMNGKTALKSVTQITDATRFGGWGINKDEIEGFGSELADVPSTWQLFDELSSGKGASYSAYLCRTAWVAPIARRSGWFNNDGRNRSKVHVLCYLAVLQQDKSLIPYGPVVLSASSLTGLALDKCFKEFATKSTQARGNTPSNFFYHPIGTWGKEPKFEERKSKGGNASSSVSPPQLYVPEVGITTDVLKKWFVGADVAAEMAKYLDLAQDWVNDWKNRKSDQKQEEPNPFDQTPPEEDSFPF